MDEEETGIEVVIFNKSDSFDLRRIYGYQQSMNRISREVLLSIAKRKFNPQLEGSYFVTGMGPDLSSLDFILPRVRKTEASSLWPLPENMPLEAYFAARDTLPRERLQLHMGESEEAVLTLSLSYGEQEKKQTVFSLDAYMTGSMPSDLHLRGKIQGISFQFEYLADDSSGEFIRPLAILLSRKIGNKWKSIPFEYLYHEGEDMEQLQENHSLSEDLSEEGFTFSNYYQVIQKYVPDLNKENFRALISDCTPLDNRVARNRLYVPQTVIKDLSNRKFRPGLLKEAYEMLIKIEQNGGFKAALQGSLSLDTEVEDMSPPPVEQHPFVPSSKTIEGAIPENQIYRNLPPSHPNHEMYAAPEVCAVWLDLPKSKFNTKYIEDQGILADIDNDNEYIVKIPNLIVHAKDLIQDENPLERDRGFNLLRKLEVPEKEILSLREQYS